MKRPPRVLLVNCFPDEREMYGEYLTHVGFDPVQECDAHHALAKAREMKPHVIVTDIVLPHGMDGIELIRRLRSTPETQTACVVVVSGLVTPAHQKATLEAGANVFLMKPCLPEVLAREIRECVRRKR